MDVGISLLGSFFTFNRKFLTETKRSSKLVPSKVFLMWIRQEENKKSEASYSASIPLHKPSILKLVVIHPSMDLHLLA